MKTKKLETVKDWLEELKKYAISKTPTEKEAICALTVAGMIAAGPFKINVYRWLKEEYPLRRHFKIFHSAWMNLRESGIVKNGKIIVEGKKGVDAVEFCLFICIAQGYIKRGEKK